jgi:hypothetical protein
MPLKITFKQTGWRVNSLRGYCRPKFNHVLSRTSAEFKTALSGRRSSRQVLLILITLLAVVGVLVIYDFII